MGSAVADWVAAVELAPGESVTIADWVWQADSVKPNSNMVSERRRAIIMVKDR
jgi:hypothetical protein